MLQKKLPLLLVVPQAGTFIPSELRTDPKEIPDQTNTPAFRLGASLCLEERLEYLIAGELSPALLKLDAPRDDALAEHWPQGTPIYALAKKNVKPLKQKLLADYYQGWHRRVAEALASRRVKLALDCFVLPGPEATAGRPNLLGTSNGTSAGRPDGLGTSNGTSAGRPNPHRIMLALGNQGDERGDALPGAGPLSCPADLTRDLRDMLSARFSDLPGRVGLNPPLSGGHLAHLHARQSVPWIRFGVAPELLREPEGELGGRRVEQLRERVEGVLVMFCKLQGWI